MPHGEDVNGVENKKFVIINVIIICWALFLESFAFVSLIPEYLKASLVCNGMPEFAVRLMLGEPDDESDPSEEYGKPSNVFAYYDFGKGKRMRYARCSGEIEIPLLSEMLPEIRINWVEHLVWINLIGD